PDTVIGLGLQRLADAPLALVVIAIELHRLLQHRLDGFLCEARNLTRLVFGPARAVVDEPPLPRIDVAQTVAVLLGEPPRVAYVGRVVLLGLHGLNSLLSFGPGATDGVEARLLARPLVELHADRQRFGVGDPVAVLPRQVVEQRHEVAARAHVRLLRPWPRALESRPQDRVPCEPGVPLRG